MPSKCTQKGENLLFLLGGLVDVEELYLHMVDDLREETKHQLRECGANRERWVEVVVWISNQDWLNRHT